MDSEDEGSGEEESEHEALPGLEVGGDQAQEAAGLPRRHSGSEGEAQAQAEDGATRADAPALPRRIEEVQTFGEFVRITPALISEVGGLPVDQLAALCATAARLRYFDGDLFGRVFEALKARFLAGEVTTAVATEIVQQLVVLNAYDKEVFTAAATSIQPRIYELNKEQRLRWLSMLEQANHTSSPAFVEALRVAPVLEDIPITTSSSGRIPCRHYARGFCALGRACVFAHEMGLTPPPMPHPTVLTQTQFFMRQAERRGGCGAGPPQLLGPRGRPFCRHHARGFCALGKNCTFPHGDPAQDLAFGIGAPGAQAFVGPTGGVVLAGSVGPLPRGPPITVKNKVCIHFQSGSCSWGDKCHFLHRIPPQLPAP